VAGTSVGRPLRDVVGEGVRRVREAAGLRQDDVARVARAHGLAWSQSKVAALERGDKAVSPEELVTIALVLGRASGRDVRVTDLLDSDETVTLTPCLRAPARSVARLLAGSGADDATSGIRQTPARADHVTRAGDAEEKAGRRLGEHAAVVVTLSRALWGRTLAEERDRIVSERDPDASPDRRRALRGQVTKQLVEQLADEIRRQEPGE
jgi:transcriptional regulator with XRE-family HTH domain